MPRIYVPDRLFDGLNMQDGMAVIVEEGRVRQVIPVSALGAAESAERLSGLLVPGFIDVQVNGGGGVLFNDQRSVQGIAAIGKAHRAYGTTGFMVTFITDTQSRMREAVAAATAALDAGLPGLLGIHVEGPFLNPLRKGVHNPALMRPLDEEDVAILASVEGGVSMVTVAPECVDLEKIRDLCNAGVIVSAGHTAASSETLANARSLGLTGFTHLFNAMPPFAGRDPGPIGFALADRGSFCGLIVDGFHVHVASMQAAIRAKGPEHIMLVTDAMPGVGTASSSFMLQGRNVVRKDGRCALEVDGSLAGSDLDMATAVRNACAWLDVTLEQALRMASAVPAAFLGLQNEFGRIATGYRANFALLDSKLEVTGTWINGDYEVSTARQ
ncbi:N-acetylglucosamine 6-phosphate deacetylase [Arboricoccus pini]|uniref:N-acetylglucosamine 6-phosphate deacetylase n=1 Tax=Arboricoccus pini TaxID=1963835 RepID=A0A212R7I4_9PROT|nr:N-acetylglucosamine-6-phosphate deacetylase [Arboricoccus pini]SNB68146.1 N-acetylglucosamine 6-phosphate deacetylase [Arboricoccus pini]